jgi:hypothetical protein
VKNPVSLVFTIKPESPKINNLINPPCHTKKPHLLLKMNPKIIGTITTYPAMNQSDWLWQQTLKTSANGATFKC